MQAEKPKKSRSLAATLTLAFLGLSFGVLLIANLIQILTSIQIQQVTIANQQQVIAQDAANAVSSFIQTKFNELEAAIQVGDPAVRSAEERETILENILGLDRAIQLLVLFTPGGETIATASRLSQIGTEEAIKQIDSGMPSLFAETRAGNRYISPIYVDRVNSEPFIVIAVPEIDAFGDFQSILLAQINLKFMWDLVDRLEVGDTGQAYVVDRQGNLLAFSDVTRVIGGENVGDIEQVRQFINAPAVGELPDASVSRGIEGTNVMGTYVPLGQPDWAVVTEVPLLEAYNVVFQNVGVSIVVFLISTVLAGLMGGLVARRLAVPLVKLTETATQVAEGDLDLETTVQGPTEVISLAEAFNSMTAQLRDLIGSLEQQVERRTRALETSTDVSRRLSTILDQDQLVKEVVEELRAAFGYYHAHIYFYDDNRRNLVMAGGTGDAGRTMLARGHKIETGLGLVGQAAKTNESILIPDVSEATGWLPNPLLPDTKAEVAVPIAVGKNVLGVLDVQHNVANGLSQEDTDLIQAIANQVAIAIQNAQAYTETQRQAIREAQVTALSQQIQMATTIEDVLKIAVSELGQVLEVERANVELTMAQQAKDGSTVNS
jgi:GAF domain-containing protein/HAMP domain-containing protein